MTAQGQRFHASGLFVWGIGPLPNAKQLQFLYPIKRWAMASTRNPAAMEDGTKELKRLAIFDYDGTIVSGQSGLLISRYMFRAFPTSSCTVPIGTALPSGNFSASS